MHLVLAIIDLSALAGLLWSLWYVLGNPRRRARHIAAELSAPLVSESAPLSVGRRRWVSGATAAFFALFAVDAAVLEHEAGTLVLLLVICVPMAALSARAALSAKPVLVIDDDGIVVTRPPRRLRWNDIESTAIEERTGTFGVEQQHLVLRLAAHCVEPPQRGRRRLATRERDIVRIPLYLMTPSWPRIARAISERSGRTPAVPTKYAHAGP
jgi:hypothetical protein